MPPISRHDRNYKSRSGATAWIGIGIACLLAVGLYMGGQSFDQKRQADNESMRHAVAGVKSDVQNFEDQLNNHKATGQPLHPIAIASNGAQDAGSVWRTFTVQLFNQEIELKNQYHAELQAAGCVKLLDPDRIKEDPGMTKSLRIIADAKLIVEKYRAKTHALLASLRPQILALNVDERTRQDFLRGFDESTAKSTEVVDEQWNLEARIVEEAGDIVKLLHDRKGHWKVINRKIVFGDQSDLDAFNNHLTAIRDFSQAENRTQAAQMAKMNSQLDQMR